MHITPTYPYYRLAVWILLLTFPVIDCAGQENKQFVYPVWVTDDTARIMNLLRTGKEIRDNYPDSAMSLLREAVQQSRTYGFEDGIGYGLSFMGDIACLQGRQEQGFSWYREALPYCLRARYIRMALPSLYINIGRSYFNRGEYRLANDFYYKALDFLQAYAPSSDLIIRVHINISGVMARLGAYDDAIATARRAAAMARKTQNQAELAATLINIGNIYIGLRKTDSARYYFELGRIPVHLGGIRQHEQILLTSIGDLLLEEQKPREAIPYYEAAMAVDPSNPFRGMIMPGYSLGIAYFRMKSYAQAANIMEQALQKAAETGLTENRQHALAYLAAIYEDMGRPRQALQITQEYIRIKDSIMNVDKARAINELQVKYQTAEKDRELTRRQLRISRQERELERKNVIITVIAAGSLSLVTLLVGSWRNHRHRRRMQAKELEIGELKATMKGEENERARVARDLHDGIGGMLTALNMHIKAVKNRHRDIPQMDDLNEIMDLLRKTSLEVHQTAHNLMPDILERYSLPEALHLFCSQLEHHNETQLRLQFHGDMDSLDKSLSLTVYRIVQELIQNVIRHAAASFADVQLQREGNNLHISVEDNGKGFNPGEKGAGLGLHNIRTRVQALDGHFSVESAPGQGTTIYIQLDTGRQVRADY